MKLFIVLGVLFISGCAHHGGYHSGYSGSRGYGHHVERYSPRPHYPSYYGWDHDDHIPAPYACE